MMDTTTVLVLVCALAILAAGGAVSPWAPVMAPVLSMLASSVLACGLNGISSTLNPPK